MQDATVSATVTESATETKVRGLSFSFLISTGKGESTNESTSNPVIARSLLMNGKTRYVNVFSDVNEFRKTTARMRSYGFAIDGMQKECVSTLTGEVQYFQGYKPLPITDGGF